MHQDSVKARAREKRALIVRTDRRVVGRFLLHYSSPTMLSDVEYRLLRRFYPGGSSRLNGSAYTSKSKLETLFGPEFWHWVRGKTVIDYGCGIGTEVAEIAAHDAGLVIGLDNREAILATARERVSRNNVVFTTRTNELADLILSLDAFEHFSHPHEVLEEMASLLKPEGSVFVSFGPPWLHPLGGHLFSVFPWAHLTFTERALMRWRADFKDDGATRFEECSGGLNRMTVGKFEDLVAHSSFRFAEKRLEPIRRTASLHNRFTREFLTSTIRCRLVKR